MDEDRKEAGAEGTERASPSQQEADTETTEMPVEAAKEPGHGPDVGAAEETQGPSDSAPRGEGEEGGDAPPAASEEGVQDETPEQPSEGAQEAETEAQEPGDPEARIRELEEELEQTRNRLLRIAADFENYRKRMQRELARSEERATEKVLAEVLPVLDNLERALEHAETNSEDVTGLRKGVALVLKQFRDALAKFGVTPFDSKGKPFDPTFHEAVGQVETETVSDGHVVEEWQRGYMIGDRLLRPAMVVVAKAPAGEAPPEPRGEVIELEREAEEDRSEPTAPGRAGGESSSAEPDRPAEDEREQPDGDAREEQNADE